MARRLHLCALLAALALAGCGADGPGPDGAAVADAPSVTGELKVGATGLRLGAATTARTGDGVRVAGRGGAVDPAALRPGAPDREGVGAGASCPDGELLPDAANLAAVGAATLCLLNGERADAGLPALASNDRLALAALGHSQDMVAAQYFSHVAADGRDLVGRVRPTGYIDPDRGWTVGENLAWGSGTLSTPRSIVAAWMTSDGHRDNLLNPAFREIGLGIVAGSPRARDMQGAATYTTVFGAIAEAPARAEAPRPSSSERRATRRRAAKRRAARRSRAARASKASKASRARSARRAGRVRARIAIGPRATIRRPAAAGR